MTELQKALDSIQALSPEQRTSLRTLLDDDAPSEATFAERMVALGVLERRRQDTSTPSFDPVPTEGTPASHIILEDRR